MRKNKNKIIIILVTILLIVSGLVYLKASSKRKTEIISTNIEEKVSRIVELSTIKFNYTDVISYKDSVQLQGLNIPFTGKSFIIKYSGYIKAGVDLQSMDFNIVDNNTIDIKMDKAKILENIISEEDVVFFDEKDGLFNKLSFKDLYKVLIGEKEKAKEEAIERGLLIDAENNVREILISLLEGMGYRNVNIKFK